MPRAPQIDLPLRAWTPRQWAAQALRDPLALLNDHAHLERKAASNALEMLLRWPEPAPPEKWVLMMTAVARDEIDHLATVTKILARRGGKLVKNHRSPYANALRDLVRLGDGARELMDRLMVCSLIEARSCERFELLSRSCDDDAELSRLYRDLWGSEHGHYRVFLSLAEEVCPARAVKARWEQMLEAEAQIIQRQPPGARMHGWVEPVS